jgi:hypothetical protein
VKSAKASASKRAAITAAKHNTQTAVACQVKRRKSVVPKTKSTPTRPPSTSSRAQRAQKSQPASRARRAW